ncbi:type II toxin-antitoxin system ParD family antitoxin [Floridanema evergladense]|uniref:Type II toxin-antitoxin system ParD family antitoxin n=1 Tax=Floridaenema evergladense BLCC-F167 TaxID=3153639 RepID=A0ABV4WSZ3_9CYAN
MNITIPPERENFIQSQLATGKYESAEQIVDEALKLLERRNEQAKLLAEIRQHQWQPLEEIPDSVTLLRKLRGYDD